MKSTFLLTLFLFSLQLVSAQSVKDQNSHARDQTVSDDLIVIGNGCIGLDCLNGEVFGTSTLILKQDILRLRFEDTGMDPFPGNDWEIQINEAIEGGASHFAIQDVSANRLPFVIEAGARSSSIYVDNGGRVGFKTNNPVTELHTKDGDTPTLRLEQDGSSGFAPQTWDLAGNETSFFIRDATNGSTLPFRIRPGAASNSLIIDTDGDVGVGILSPKAKLHVSGADTARILVENTDNSIGSRTLLSLSNLGPTKINIRNTELPEGEWNTTVVSDGRYVLKNQADMIQDEFALDPDGNLVLSGDLTANTLLILSDRRLKDNVSKFEDGIESVMKLNPVTYNYNGKAGLNRDSGMHIGLIAQELQEVAPYLVQNHTYREENRNGELVSSSEFLKIDPLGIQYLLINAMKDQQKELDEKDEKIKALEDGQADMVARLAQLELTLDKFTNNGFEEILLRGDTGNAVLGQNRPNPYEAETIIDYFVPERSQSSEIRFFDMTGKFLDRVVISRLGKGELRVKAEDLPNGTYIYSLVIDHQIIESRKMTHLK